MAELFKVNAPVRKPLFEGVQGENEARSIQFDITPWVEELGDGAVTATAKRSQDSQPYPVTVTKDGTTVTWKPTSTDTAFAGVGSFQLEYTVDSVLAKTCIWSTMVAPSLDPAGDPPDPYDNYLAEMRQIAADAIQAAQDADASADDAQAEVYEAEAWAKGTKNGTPVPSTADQYENNAKYFAEESYKNAEAWAVGQRGGVDVPSTDPTYENNAKYWAEQSLANQYGAYIVKSASGEIASFSDGADDVPMKSLNVTITPKQSGSGDPSPSNVRPITGTSTANVFVTGKNLFGGEYSVKYDLFIPAGHTVTVSAHKTGSANLYFSVYDKSGSVIDYWTVTNTSGTRNYRTFTFAYDVYGVRFYNSASDDMQIELGSTPTDYIPYTGHTTPVPLGQTVYGGEVNPISGELKITHAIFNMKGRTWSKSGNTFYTQLNDVARPAMRTNNIMCNAFKSAPNNTWFSDIADLSCCSYNQPPGSYTGQNWIYFRDDSCGTSAEFKTKVDALSEFYIVAPKSATPTTVQLTPTQVATLLGTNNVWSDAGSVEVEYRADPTLAYAELEALILENI